jgi:hypothetical protein
MNRTLESPIDRLRKVRPAILDRVELFLPVDEQEAYLRELPTRSIPEQRVRRRRARTRYVLFAVVFAVLAVMVGLVVLPQRAGPNRSDGLRKAGHQHPVHVHLSGGVSTIPGFLVPTYLPPGATQIPNTPATEYQHMIATFEEGAHDPALSPSDRQGALMQLNALEAHEGYYFAHTAFFDYGIPGAANNTTVTADFALQIEESTIALGDNSMGGFLTFSPIMVNGVRGQLTMPSSGFGYYSISWTVGNTNYSVTSSRFNTSYGISGLTMEEALRVADGMKPPSGPVVSS